MNILFKKNSYKNRLSGGYSLIELVTYIALFVALSLLLMQSLITAVRVYAASEGTRALTANGDLSLDRITREIRNATTISNASTFGMNPSTLILSGTDANGAVRTVSFYVSNGQLQLSDNGVVSALSTSSVTATNFTVFHTINTSSDAVRIILTFATVKGQPQRATFYNTALTRQK